jgi:hypothetical protein
VRKPSKAKSGKKQLDKIEKKEDLELRKIGRLEHEVEEIEKALKKPKKKALRKINFKPAGEKKMPTDFSIVAGTTGSFSAILTPPGGAQAPGTTPQWSSSDATVVLTPSTDGMKVDAAVPASETASSFDLSILAVSSDSGVGTVSKTHSITVSATPLTAIDFAQTA